MKANTVDHKLIGIFYNALRKWIVFIALALGLYLCTSDILSFVLLGILLCLIHITNVYNVTDITKFIELKKAVYEQSATYSNRSKKENLFHNIALFPISAGVTVLLSSNNIFLIVFGIILIYFLLVYGETAKYRFKLYKIYYDNHVA